MSAELKTVPARDDKFERALSMSNLNTMQSELLALKASREREIEDVQRQVDVLQEKLEKHHKELYIIEGKRKAIKTAIRTLEDLGITN